MSVTTAGSTGMARVALPQDAARRSAGGLGAALLRTTRPRQWVKNVLVFAAPAAAGALAHPHVAAAAVRAFASFTLAAAGTYFLNDAADVAADRLHPVKSARPVAAGLISPRAAAATGFGLAGAAVAVAALASWAFAAVVTGYLVLTAAYSWRLKHVPVLDILAVAAGFLLRAVGGAVAAGVAASNWFLLVALLGSLYLVTSKRTAERERIQQMGGSPGSRPALARYSTAWLHQIMTMSLTGAVMAYALWAFQYAGRDAALPVVALSLVPFLAALMRYGLLVARGGGESPERLLLSDRFLLLAGLSWGLTIGSGLYLA